MLLLMLEQGHSDVEKYWDNFSGKKLFHMASAKFENMQVNEGSDFFSQEGRDILVVLPYQYILNITVYTSYKHFKS